MGPLSLTLFQPLVDQRPFGFEGVDGELAGGVALHDGRAAQQIRRLKIALGGGLGDAGQVAGLFSERRQG